MIESGEVPNSVIKKLNINELDNFCAEYIRSNDPSLAAKAIGIVNDCLNRGLALLETVEVRKRLVEKFNAINLVYSRERDMLMNEFINIAQFNIGDFAEWSEDGRLVFKGSDKLDEKQLRRIASVSKHIDKNGNVTLKLDFYDKMAVLDKLAKILGLYIDRHQIEARVNPADYGSVSEEQKKLAAEYSKKFLTATDEGIDAEYEDITA
jgi:hypothetical protein